MRSKRNTLGKYLYKQREKAEFTQLQVAVRIGYKTAQFISNVERGCCYPTRFMLKNMIRIYKLNPDKVIEIILKDEKRRWKEHLK